MSAVLAPGLRLPPATRLPVPAAPPGWMAGGLGAFFPRRDAEGGLELFVSGRDAAGTSRIGLLRYAGFPEAPRLAAASAPLLGPGEPGGFDADGVGYPWLVEDRLYYVGWQRLGGAVPFRNQLGLALGGAQGFWRHSRAPLLAACDAEPIGHGSCCVERLGPGRWRMLYTCFLGWEAQEGGGLRHRYRIHAAWSDDGLAWQLPGQVAVDFDPAAEEEEYALASPVTWQGAGPEELLLFTARGARYRLHAARGGEGGRFRRLACPIAIAAGAWDDAMQCYPRLLRWDGRDVLFHAGNGYGRAGIGYSLLPAGWEARLA
ncbi:hypothetical protein [Pseudoroseomonas cervicalis]|uniref:hypothetical protein n=1 Tax=Teichococcus cervicalis TaxID=204525 RepID=UPI0022F18FA5|nr:hypothetical protein [Pseudoroseomonas cervicalis]WBV45501.1 hypothetical protein PFY06_21725 [Pseudoroseomonas cervicalis]